MQTWINYVRKSCLVKPLHTYNVASPLHLIVFALDEHPLGMFGVVETPCHIRGPVQNQREGPHAHKICTEIVNPAFFYYKVDIDNTLLITDYDTHSHYMIPTLQKMKCKLHKEIT